jgi:hypothetical protein
MGMELQLERAQRGLCELTLELNSSGAAKHSRSRNLR